MDRYYLFSEKEQTYKSVDESTFLSLVAEKQRKNYANKVYRGEIELGGVPEEHREIVQKLVDEKVVKYGKYEDKVITPVEAVKAIEKLPGVKLTRGMAKALFADIERLRSGATDAVASTAVSAYPRLKEDGSLVKAGTRINWNGVLKRAAADLWDTAENNPDNAPALWENIDYRDGYRIIPETITATLAFSEGECGWWEDKLYRSKVTGNVYTPAVYPANWEEV